MSVFMKMKAQKQHENNPAVSFQEFYVLEQIRVAEKNMEMFKQECPKGTSFTLAENNLARLNSDLSAIREFN
jgi:hypothetical protein